MRYFTAPTLAALLLATPAALAGTGYFYGNSDDYKVFDTFADYTAAATCEFDGGVFGPWTAAFDGGGCTKIIAGPKLQTGGSTNNAALVYTGATQGDPTLGQDTYLEVKYKTTAQNRTPTPNTYEVGWVTWNGHFDSGCSCYVFNYFTLKPTIGGTAGGYELGVVYNNGGTQAQCFEATGSANYAINHTYDVTIWDANAAQNGPGNVVTVTVSDNGGAPTTLINGHTWNGNCSGKNFASGWAVGLYEEASTDVWSYVNATRL
jgi:hypothetical protein